MVCPPPVDSELFTSGDRQCSSEYSEGTPVGRTWLAHPRLPALQPTKALQMGMAGCLGTTEPSLLGTALPCQVYCTPPHQDPRTCLLQGPILRICVLAVLLIGRRQQRTTYHSLQALSYPGAQSTHGDHTQKGGGTAKGNNYGTSLTKGWLGIPTG